MASVTESKVLAREPLRYVVHLETSIFEARELAGSEACSEPFRFEVSVRIDDVYDLHQPDNLIGRLAFIRLQRGDESLRSIRAVITEVSLAATERGKQELRFVLEPQLALLRHRVDLRIFRDKTAPEIVAEVLADSGISCEQRLQASYARRPYCVQFRERDLDFIHRLLEEEGIHYFFLDDHARNFNRDATTLVLGDVPEAYQDLHRDVVLPFRPAKTMEREHEVIYDLGRRAALAPSQVSLNDFNPDKPSLDMQVHAVGPTPAGVEYYDYPGEYLLPEEGQRRANLMAESFKHQAAAAIGASDCGRLIPGHSFTLTEAPATVPDGRYVVTRVEHRWERAESPYSNRFQALEGDQAYRRPLVTPKPMQSDLLTGFVTGPKGTDIHTDEMGRVKVYFPWDRRQPQDDACSHWIPVLQDDTGHSVAIPRVGWEVLVGFMEGDPDRPVVLGRVYDGADPFPEPLPEGKTRSALKSLSSPSRAGSNLIRIDDFTGKELVNIQAEKDQNVVVAHDKTEQVLNTETNQVDGDETIEIGGNAKIVVGNDRTALVHKDQTWSVAASRERRVKTTESVDIKGSRSVRISATHFRRVAKYDTVKVGGLCEFVGGLDLEVSLKPNSTNAEYGLSLTVGGALIELAFKEKSETVNKLRFETIGGLLFTSATTQVTIDAKDARRTTVGGLFNASAEKTLQMKADGSFEGTTMVSATADADESVTLKVGDNHLSIKGGEISIKAAEKVTITATGSQTLGADEAQLNP
jgi:type VI secretion system secreted protein VgrG